ncbi:MAG: FAD:protein FMN transferase [Clostridia bacterium]|nr:FAD:protein FMN transferase [Clostridia bacterium]NCC42449.1 FAD:protein FMN transferase [Clostridia bacterium]
MKFKSIWIPICLSCSILLAGCTKEAKSDVGLPEDTQVNIRSDMEEVPKDNEDTVIKEAQKELFAMDTYMTLSAYGDSAQAAVDDAAAEIERLDQLLSTGDAASEIAKLNESGSAVLSEDGGYLVERALELYEDTAGAFDIAVYPIMEEWGFTTQEYQVPSDERIEELLKLTQADEIKYDEKSREISFGIDGMKIDLGGIAKGYTSARIMDIYKQHGIESGLVNLGGNVQTMGHKTDGSSWRVAVQSPDESEEYLGILDVNDKAVITSGGYERYFEENGVSYHHIIDPSDGHPADSGLISVTIVSADGTLADGLSTSLFIMGKEKAAAYWADHSEEFDAILEAEDGTLYITEGIEEEFVSEHPMEILRKDAR